MKITVKDLAKALAAIECEGGKCGWSALPFWKQIHFECEAERFFEAVRHFKKNN